MTKETMKKAQELDSKISKLDGDIKILEDSQKSAAIRIYLTVCEEHGERRMAFLKEEFDTNAVFRVLLDMYIEKRDKLQAEFLAL